MEQNPPSQSKLSTPLAIIIAGVIIAGAVMLTNFKGGVPTTTTTTRQGVIGTTPGAALSITIPPITAKDHYLGSTSAPLVLVEYSDLECPFCKSFNTTLENLMGTYGKAGQIAWVYRNFPIAQLHPQAPKEALAAECANSLGAPDGSTFWKFIHEVFTITPSNNGLDLTQLPKIASDSGVTNLTAFQSCLDNGTFNTAISQTIQDAMNAGAQGTPFTVIVSKTKISDAAIATINTLAAQFPPGTVAVSSDDMRVEVSGALPQNFMETILKTLLGQA